MRQALIATLIVSAASAQTMVSPADVPVARRALEPREGEKTLRCNVEPTRPSLNFSLRFQSGYLLEVPLVQYYGGGHTWTTTVRVTPDSGAGQPVYLTDRTDLPATAHPEFTAQVTGMFLLGEGRYKVDFAVVDDTGRTCRKDWQITAAVDRSERSIKVDIPPNSVADFSYEPLRNSPTAPPVPRRITVFMNTSPPYWPNVSPNRSGMVVAHFSEPEFVDYREALLGMLSSLVEKLPGTAVRLVVFDLEQQREVLRQDNFSLKDMEKAAHAADDLEHWVVTVRELQEQPGPWGLLANLIKREIAEQEPSDVILFLGPRIGSHGEMPAHFLDAEKRADARLLYLQYALTNEGIFAGLPPEMGKTPPERHPFITSDIRELPQMDDIDRTVARLKGKTLSVLSALDFAKAVETIKRLPESKNPPDARQPR